MPIVYTKDEDLGRIISHPSGNNPYYLARVPQEEVDRAGLQDQVVEDTAEFYSHYDLDQGEEDEEMI